MVRVQLEYYPMHLFYHGLTIHVLKYGIKQLLRLEEKLGLPKYTLVKKLIQRLRLQKGNVRGRDGQTLSRHHQTLLGLPNTVVKLLNGLAGKSSESKRSSPMVECNEMQRLAVCLPYVFEGLAAPEVAKHNKGKAGKQVVKDPTIGITEVCEDYITLYHNARCVFLCMQLYIIVCIMCMQLYNIVYFHVPNCTQLCTMFRHRPAAPRYTC